WVADPALPQQFAAAAVYSAVVDLAFAVDSYSAAAYCLVAFLPERTADCQELLAAVGLYFAEAAAGPDPQPAVAAVLVLEVWGPGLCLPAVHLLALIACRLIPYLAAADHLVQLADLCLRRLISFSSLDVFPAFLAQSGPHR